MMIIRTPVTNQCMVYCIENPNTSHLSENLNSIKLSIRVPRTSVLVIKRSLGKVK